jgi:U6 snRNA-associated Sm-like protein LSm1
MEKLSLDDRPPMGHPPPQQLPGVLGMAPPVAPQLPPQMFTTAAQLLNLTDSELPMDPFIMWGSG